MRSDVLSEATELVAAGRQLYARDQTALAVLGELDRRLQEPLRLALAGIVKAGKSTLLNAMLGEQIAPTDAGECTRVVTWYRYADTPSITAHLSGGEERRLPVRRVDGKLILDLGDLTSGEVDRIEVGWPSGVLRSMILIDTPGIASLSQDLSARSTTFLAPEDAPSSADAIVYLLRHLHPSDMRFLEAFRDTAAGPSQTVNAVAVLSRADEIGSGRIDSLLSAGKVSKRYELDGDLNSLALGVVPVAGLLAEGARTLRESEFAAFRRLASLERRERERLLLSSDRFVGAADTSGLDVPARRELLARFGIFGVRLATSLIRTGVSDSTELANRLIQHSGLHELNRFVETHFGPRTPTLKVRAVLDALERLLRDRPIEGSEAIVAGIERIRATAHGLRELSLLSTLRVGDVHLPPEEAAAVVRVIGGLGSSAEARLGLPAGAGEDQILERVDAQLAHWRARGQSPILDRASLEVGRVVIRSLEEVSSQLASARGHRAATDVVMASRPLDGAGEHARD
ncbi:dynamin family protein [Tessaracoccus sp. G1721]